MIQIWRDLYHFLSKKKTKKNKKQKKIESGNSFSYLRDYPTMMYDMNDLVSFVLSEVTSNHEEYLEDEEKFHIHF